MYYCYVYSVCPSTQLITPCTCNDERIYCGGNTTINLLKIFNSLNINLSDDKKHLREIKLKGLNEFINSYQYLERLSKNEFKFL